MPRKTPAKRSIPASKKASTARRPSTRTSKKNKSSSFLKRLIPPRKFFVLVALILLAVVSLWVLALDFQVRNKFDGKKWAIPARVYARPLELYEGLRLKPSELERELVSLRYTAVKRISQPGHFSRNGGRFDIYTRDFIFADGPRKASRYRLGIEGGEVTSLKLKNGEFTAFIEPKEIGSIYPNHGEDRILITLEDTPPLLGETLIAVEDQNFAHHFGISIKGIARAMLANIKAQRFQQGGSTLTQQLVKNFYLTQERHIWRKIQEAVMSVLLELHYSKSEILEAYINEVYLGQSGPRGIHGFGLAAKHYFGQPLNRLKAQHIALLVGTVKGASYYNPWRYPERAKLRRNVVLNLMHEQQLITSAEHKKYTALPLGILKKSQLTLGDYPAFMGLVKRRLQEDYQAEDLQSEGLRIFTTLSPNVQALTEKVVQQRLKKINATKSKPNIQAAALITAVGSGEVLAIVGDRNPRYQGFNRAIGMQRAIGSLVKPFVYLSALNDSDQYNLMSMLDDSPVNIALPNGKTWQPNNFSKESYGPVPLYQALAHSYNQSTVKLGMDIGLSDVINTLRHSGLQQSPPELPSLLLGSLELSPLEVSVLYHTLAADGVYTPLRVIRSVQDINNQPLQRYPLRSEPRISANSSYLMHYNLQAVMRTGTGKRAYNTIPNELAVAGKTGTTNRQRDSWFAGYSADHLGVVWLGKDDNRPTPYTGSSGALPIWADIFGQLSTRSIQTAQPETIEYYWADQANGLLSAEHCDGAVLVPFVAGTQPQENTDCNGLEPPLQRWFNKWFGGSSNAGSSLDSNSSEDDEYGEGN